MEQEQELDLQTYIAILKRRYLVMIIPAILVFAGVLVVAYFLPRSYEAVAKILVESQQIPTDLARPTVTSDAFERIQVIEQRLMTRDNLLEIVRKFNLYDADAKKLSPSDVVDQMREAASIEQIGIGTSRAKNDAIAFTVSFEYGNPTIAAQVVNEFVSLILQQNIRSRTSRASETLRFFEKQVGDLEQSLVSMEARIIDFKKANEFALPDSLVYRRTQLSQIELELAEIERKITSLQEDRNLLTTLSAQAGADSAAIGANSNTTEAQLNQLRTKLVQLRAVYSDSHPDMKAIIAQIAALEKAASLTMDNVASAEAGAKANADIDLSTLDPRTAAQVSLIGRRIDALEAQRAELKAQARKLEESIAKTPQVEVALNALLREHASAQEQLTSARAKMSAAATGERLEEDRQSERFEIIEQATPPTEPSKPNRRKIILAGLLASLAVGGGLVVLLEMLDKSIRTSADLEKRLQLRPLAAVPYIVTKLETKRRKQRIRAFVALSASLAIATLVMLHIFYLPLQLIVEKVVQKLAI